MNSIKLLLQLFLCCRW